MVKRKTSVESSLSGLDMGLGPQVRPVRRGFASLRTMLILALCLLGIVIAAAAFLLAGFNTRTGEEPRSHAADQQTTPKAPIDLADAREVIFDRLARMGMDAGRYELDARHAPSMALQGDACEISGEISLLNTPEKARPYYAIVRQSGPLTTLLVLRVDGKVVYTRP